jgi:hypothetical protein
LLNLNFLEDLRRKKDIFIFLNFAQNLNFFVDLLGEIFLIFLKNLFVQKKIIILKFIKNLNLSFVGKGLK